MQRVEIFRFDAKRDVLAYFKPYFLETSDFANLNELFAHVKSIDPYFSPFEGFVKINGVVVSTAQPLANLAQKFRDELCIAPLSEKRAILDLAINDDDFWAKFEPFASFCKRADKELCASFKPYFYADFVREYEPNFIGAAAIMLAHHLYKNEKNDEILKLVSAKNGVLIACELDDLLFEGGEKYSEAIDFFKEILGVKAAQKHENELEKIEKLSKFKEFKIAIKDKLPANLSDFRANFIELGLKIPCGYDLLKADEELACKLASEIIFAAFDSGADFLLASNEAEFYIFDTLARKLEKSANRSLQEFYLLRASELMALENGEIPSSLKEHVLKVGLVNL
ncbi:HdrB C-terminal domain-containing protein [Campylobacter concisus]